MLLSILSVLTAVSTCIIPASGQQTCQTEILQNSTVDIDKYLNNEFHILATFATPPPDALSNCILRCCNQSNCSLAIHNATDNHTCTLIHCVSEDACKPIPSDGSEIVKTIRNNITTTESLSENQSQTTESTSDTSTTASGIGLSTSSRGDHSTSSQQSTTQDNFTESFNTTTTTTLINNATESSNYTIMSVTPNLSENGNVSVTDDVNVTFSQSNDTENSTIDSNLNQNVTSSKQETYLKNEADSNNTLMITVLIGTLSVGTLLFVAVIVVISKKIIDGWQKRHYSRIDYLVNGMYN
ncbi:serine-rich adhesin for platelets isoform X2 [Octopus sinensis]|uniref:Serine-rich adhesin for platelets isoform X2 n=1 Tax=Octopus sinensis TaxID=2607531 RepID=A0A6P7SPJ5_9MOLL|nr:serine-rich adhesin for platelets isoform X2 [Octopus sinensis]